MTTFLEFDQAIFHFINAVCANRFFDAVAPFWREKMIWLPVYASVVGFFVLNFEAKKGWLAVLALVLTVGAADQISSEILKKNVRRLRPCNDERFKNEVILRLPSCGAGFSFTSSHATNHFAAAVFLSLVFGCFLEKRGQKRPKWLSLALFFWAASIAIFQVYVGVHWPSDVFFGALLGSAVGWIGAFFYSRFCG